MNDWSPTITSFYRSEIAGRRDREMAAAAGLPTGWWMKRRAGAHFRINSVTGKETRSCEWIVYDENDRCVGCAPRKADAVAEAMESAVDRGLR